MDLIVLSESVGLSDPLDKEPSKLPKFMAIFSIALALLSCLTPAHS